MRQLALIVLCAAQLAGCYAGPGVDSPYRPTRWPEGISVSAQGAGSRPDNLVGIFPSGSGDPFCCWLSSEARFDALTPPNARTLRFTVIIPDIAPLRAQQQTVSIVIDGGASRSFPGLAVGEHMLVVPLAARHTRTSTVDMSMAFAFSPKRARLNNDSRVLSVQLRRVAAR